MEIRRPDAKVEVREPDKTIGTTGVTTATGTLTRALPGNLTVLIPVGSAEERLVNYLSSSASPGPISIGFDRIRFETASAVLSSEAREQVDNIATILRAYPNARVRVDGFTDNTGNEAANLALSRARAEMIANRLTADGVGAGRVRIEGHGSQSPLADNATEGGRLENRRVQLEVSAK